MSFAFRTKKLERSLRGQRCQNGVLWVAVDVSHAGNSLCEIEIAGPDQPG